MRDRLSLILLLAAACVMSHAATSRAAIVFDGPLPAPFVSGPKADYTPGALNVDAGFTVDIQYTPRQGDLYGTTVLAELGGTSNGFGIYLVDGIPNLISKNASSAPIVITPPQYTGNLFGQAFTDALVAGQPTHIVASFDPADGRAVIAVDASELKVFGAPVTNWNWIGDNTFGVGKIANGPGGGNNPGPDPFLQGSIKMIAQQNYQVIAWNAQPNSVSVMGSSVDLDFGGAPPAPIYAGGTGSATSGTLVGDDGFTAVLNIVPTAADLTGTVVLMENGGNSNGIGFYLVDGQVNMIAKNASNATAVITPDVFNANIMGLEHPDVLSAGQPYQIVGLFDPANDVAQLYVNGVLASVVRGSNTTGWNFTGDQSLSAGISSSSMGGTNTVMGNPFYSPDIVNFSADANGIYDNLLVNAYNIGANSIPEPASASLALFGFAALVLRRRRAAA